MLMLEKSAAHYRSVAGLKARGLPYAALGHGSRNIASSVCDRFFVTAALRLPDCDASSLRTPICDLSYASGSPRPLLCNRPSATPHLARCRAYSAKVGVDTSENGFNIAKIVFCSSRSRVLREVAEIHGLRARRPRPAPPGPTPLPFAA